MFFPAGLVHLQLAVHRGSPPSCFLGKETGIQGVLTNRLHSIAETDLQLDSHKT